MVQSHMTDDEARCELCGELMPPNESMFKFHGYSGDCPKPPLPMPPSELDQLRAEVALLREVVAAADDVDRAIALIPGDLDGYLQAMDEPIATYRSTRAALKEGK
jgi:hypothetical protein